jgi:hypothetical protein
MERLGRKGLRVSPFFGIFSSGSDRVPAIHWAATGSGLFQNPEWVKSRLCSLLSEKMQRSVFVFYSYGSSSHGAGDEHSQHG